MDVQNNNPQVVFTEYVMGLSLYAAASETLSQHNATAVAESQTSTTRNRSGSSTNSTIPLCSNANLRLIPQRKNADGEDEEFEATNLPEFSDDETDLANPDTLKILELALSVLQTSSDEHQQDEAVVKLLHAAQGGMVALAQVHDLGARIVVSAASRLLAPYVPYADSTPAASLFHDAALRFATLYKAKVFDKVFLEPTRLIFRARREQDSCVDLHGASFYLHLLERATGACVGEKPPLLIDSVQGVFPFLDRSIVSQHVYDLIYSHISNPANLNDSFFEYPENDPEFLLAAESFIAPPDSLFATPPLDDCEDENIDKNTVAASVNEILQTPALLDAFQPYVDIFMSYFSANHVLEPLYNHIVNAGLIESVLQPVFDSFMDNSENHLDVKEWLHEPFDRNGSEITAMRGSFRYDRFKMLLDFVDITDPDVPCVFSPPPQLVSSVPPPLPSSLSLQSSILDYHSLPVNDAVFGEKYQEEIKEVEEEQVEFEVVVRSLPGTESNLLTGAFIPRTNSFSNLTRSLASVAGDTAATAVVSFPLSIPHLNIHREFFENASDTASGSSGNSGNSGGYSWDSSSSTLVDATHLDHMKKHEEKSFNFDRGLAMKQLKYDSDNNGNKNENGNDDCKDDAWPWTDEEADDEVEDFSLIL
ncbi:hypothetical protein HK100_008856 [Physocladia obscura]|uniref:Uncharacterized protein n=1 Tax=Physocladia obscura TaxID=109957 RepID=A0AAD5XKZ6_9FUNG|nr:hypothetical protein HK100_008856 [Physocladia obscura]